MLRLSLAVVAASMLAGGALARALGHPEGLPVAVWGALLLLAITFERWRYHHAIRTPGAAWVATDERFVDPETGKTLQVWYQPETGERRYVAEPPAR